MDQLRKKVEVISKNYFFAEVTFIFEVSSYR
jgi:hypothetical protein